MNLLKCYCFLGVLILSCSALAQTACQFDAVKFDAGFPGGRLSTCNYLEGNKYQLLITPAFTPVNPSAWYAFKVTSKNTDTIELEIHFDSGFARYSPKVTRDKVDWYAIPYNKTEQSISFVLETQAGQPVYVSAQPILTNEYYETWLEENSMSSSVDLLTLGATQKGNLIKALDINPGNKNLLMVIGRQHPPEITGAKALESFIGRILESDKLSNKFRDEVNIVVIPQVNPDGVEEGFWRHNYKGVDLNRDWHNRTQMETQLIHDFIQERIKGGQKLIFALDFHSTNRNVYYTMPAEMDLDMGSLTQDWLTKLAHRIPFRVENSPNSRLRILIYVNTHTGECEHPDSPALGSVPF